MPEELLNLQCLRSIGIHCVEHDSADLGIIRFALMKQLRNLVASLRLPDALRNAFRLAPQVRAAVVRDLVPPQDVLRVALRQLRLHDQDLLAHQLESYERLVLRLRRLDELDKVLQIVDLRPVDGDHRPERYPFVVDVARGRKDLVEHHDLLVLLLADSVQGELDQVGRRLLRPRAAPRVQVRPREHGENESGIDEEVHGDEMVPLRVGQGDVDLERLPLTHDLAGHGLAFP
eukprot:CAMPEP_0114516332 /NCGR_PEP_ID=MMETSP0109-20121206/17268_1 /TAXON_ID=29199 /ORGANISM="Chlorarachnion reptans, Strain CCCM449" /LENGTH=231 /DNA_ID=CAMNT_0001696707 /DNA_START=154 /DNA_END=846 /DNA_ORIENTATION=+